MEHPLLSGNLWVYMPILPFLMSIGIRINHLMRVLAVLFSLSSPPGPFLSFVCVDPRTFWCVACNKLTLVGGLVEGNAASQMTEGTFQGRGGVYCL